MQLALVDKGLRHGAISISPGTLLPSSCVIAVALDDLLLSLLEDRVAFNHLKNLFSTVPSRGLLDHLS